MHKPGKATKPLKHQSEKQTILGREFCKAADDGLFIFWGGVPATRLQIEQALINSGLAK